MHKTVPTVQEKIALNLLMQPPAHEPSTPVIQPQPIVQTKVLPSSVKPLEPRPVLQPKKAITEQNKPLISIPTAPAVLNVPSVPLAKISEQPIQPSTAKAAPSAPKQQENYEEENLGRIRSVLMERLIYPKNALRLKQQGEAIVTFTLETTREVSQITISKSSGFELLDDAAKNLILSSASEFPKPSKTARISVPIAYKLR